VRAARLPIVGRERVAKFIAAVVALVTIEGSADGIDQIIWMMRPSKLAAIAPA
jgi:hypothetical protein